MLPYSIALSVLAEATTAVPSAKWAADAARWDAAFAPCSTRSLAELRPLKEPMISTRLLGFDCGQRTRVRRWEFSDGSQTILIRHFDDQRRATWNAVLGSNLSSMPKGMP
ncbi:MAG: hypothetical protein AUG50_05040 [Betaproteobacteria bacterium 13_1_20CM_3_63_8]|nr:MAG: hypothetical protein AUG50_05040 [Betaproteobacteria bacterium 13_1_20CM_3_63_8]